MPTKTFPGHYESLPEIEDFLSPLMAEVGFSSSQTYKIRLAVVEACTNIIEHGYGGEGEGEIICTAESRKNSLKIVLKDQGERFDPDRVPEPDFDVELEDLKLRGAGVYLMKKLMDEVHFAFDNGEGNTLTMIKRK